MQAKVLRNLAAPRRGEVFRIWICIMGNRLDTGPGGRNKTGSELKKELEEQK